MSSIVKLIAQEQLANVPSMVKNSVQYEVITGSQAYGTSQDDSDWDVYGFCIPNKEVIFPHLAGEIIGFGRNKQRFEQWQQHHIEDKQRGKNYDCTIFNIVKFFSLLMENNPNMLDVLFVPDHCIIHCSRTGKILRDNRKIFVHKGCYHKLLGYSYSQLHKMDIKNPQEGSKRDKYIKDYGYDVKYAMHTVRLVLECEQLLLTGEMDLQRDREMLKSIRRGEWTIEQVKKFAKDKEEYLKGLYEKSEVIPHNPDEEKIKALLLKCLEEYYGSIDNCIGVEDQNVNLLREIYDSLEKNKKNFGR